MPAFTIFDEAVRYIADGTIDMDSHTFKAVLTNTAPVQGTNTVLADITQIAAGNGYTTGGVTLAGVALAETGAGTGIWRWTFTAPAWTATGGDIATHRYLVVYDDTPTSPADPLIGFVDRGSSAVITSGSSRTWTIAAGVIDFTRSP